MRAVLFALFCLAGCAAAPAHSVLAPSESFTTIEACLASATPETRRACVGRQSAACMTIAGNETTAGMVQCAQAERRAWEVLRDRQVATLRASESPTQVALLDAALNEHTRWATARCAYEASIYEGGSLARVVGAGCMRDTIAEHYISLIGRGDLLE